MRGWLKAGLAMALTLATAPAVGQSQYSVNGSEGEAFLEAIEKGDNNKAIPLIEEPGSRVANYKGYKGETALHIATRKRELDWVGYLLKKGADPNIGDSQGDTALIIASRIGFEEAVEWMLRLGARVDTPNRRGETALIVAVQQRQPAIVKMLLENGADPDKQDHASGYSAREYAKRDTRSHEILSLIETVKSKRSAAIGPTRP
jgi:ankyrin repeat protein